jgi:hypothetical protein
MASLEERVAALEQKNNQLETKNAKMQHELERVQAVVEIQNLMSRYEYWHTSDQHDKKGKFIATKAEGARIEYNNSGVYEGTKGLRKFLVELHSMGGGVNRRPGNLTVHPLTTPVIEVAGDGKTARGLWLSPGIETHNFLGKIIGCAVWEAYAADFIKEDGIWKWWRIHLNRCFITPYDKSWVDVDVDKFYESLGIGPSMLPPELQPDRPTTYFKMFKMDDTCGWTEGIPTAPEPYEHYEEWMAVVKKAD